MDYYRGYRIPRGSSVVVNQWYEYVLDLWVESIISSINNRAILRDESVYTEADKFFPDRFLYQDDPSKAIFDPRTVVFGYGRRRVNAFLLIKNSLTTSYRKCPGRLFAEDATWYIMASILTRFSITPAEINSQDDLHPEALYCSSLIRYVMN